MEKIGVGIASFGMSGLVFHGPLLSINPSFRILAILERSKSQSAGKFPESTMVRSFKELLDFPGVDLVIVNTPDPLHYEMCRQALLAGKHVVVEKPFVRDSRQGEELIELASSLNRILSVFQNRRWDGDFLTIREILETGLLGRLVEFEAHFDRFRNYIPEGTWKEKEGSGSTIYNLGSHLIDQALVLFGLPEFVYADIRTLRDEGAIDDAFTLMLGYDEVKVTLKASYLVKQAGPRYYLHGTHGSFLKWGIDPQEDELKKGRRPEGADWGLETEENHGILNTELEGKEQYGKYPTLAGNYAAYYSEIADAILSGSENYVKAEQANQVIRVIEAGIRSNESGKRIPL